MPENEYHKLPGEVPRPEEAGAVRTARLDLVPMAPAVLRALLAGNRAGAAVLLGATLPNEWEVHADVLEIRLRQLTNDPTLQPWLLRAMVLRETGEAVGGIGFHDAPRRRRRDDPTAGSAEAGYWVSGSRRRQGLASEAFQALMDWAQRVHGVRRFVVSVSPTNMPSLALASKLGFRRTGSQMDEIDGLEWVFERKLPGRSRAGGRRLV